MAAKLEVVITECGGRLELEIKGSGKRTHRENLYLEAIVGAIKIVADDLGKRAAECDCPACQKKRKQEVNHEPQNLH